MGVIDIKSGLYDAAGAGVTGSSDMKCKVKRDADDQFFDFNDSTFKAAGHITLEATMSEPDSTNIPGEYETALTVTEWDDGVYTAYVEYEGTPTWTSSVEFRVYDGEESSPLMEQLGTQAKADVNTEADTALSDYDPPTRAEATADKDEIIVQVDANETKIDIITAAIVALNDPTAAVIAAAVMASIIDGTLTLTIALKVILALLSAGDSTQVSGTYTFKDQAGNNFVVQIITDTSVETTIS